MSDFGALCLTAAAIGFVHTLAGPDHYVPFVAMSRIGNWSTRKTTIVTLLCGLGHVGGSVVLALLGVAWGLAVMELETIDAHRGDVAAWMLIGFGLAYLSWGLWTALRDRRHTHLHVHGDGTVHTHTHSHQGEHLHVHQASKATNAAIARHKGGMGPWVLFTIFLFGPCEALIPLVMYAAARGSWWNVASVTTFFGTATLATMTAAVLVLRTGLTAFWPVHWHRFSRAAAGLLILACGVAVKSGL